MSNGTSAQFKFRQPPNRQDPKALSVFDEEVIWGQFLKARNLGTFTLEGTLVHRPARAASRVVQCRLSGDWSKEEQVTQITLVPDSGDVVEKEIRLPLPDADEAILEKPLFEDLPFTWADVLMPCLQWSDVQYVGPDRYLGRPAHRFRLLNDDPDKSPAMVVVTIDEDYAALLKLDYMNANGDVTRRIRVGGFKQFSNEWMFSELYWEHRLTRESVRLEVSAFSLGQQ